MGEILSAAAKQNYSRWSRQSGETLLSLLVSLGLIGIVFAAVTSSFFDSSHRSMDLQIKSRAEEEVKAVLEMMAFDIRMMGSGMPLGQSTFPIGGSGLGTAPLPILTSSTATKINFRLNELGNNTVLTSAYTPSSTTLTLSVLSSSDLSVGNTIYVSDMLVGGTLGLKGVVTAVGTGSVSIDSSYVATSSATFKSGSTVDKVSNIIYDSPADWSGVTRDNGTGAVVISPNTQFSITYYDTNGTALALPLTESMVANSLASVGLKVSARGDRTLSEGETYTATATQRIALRNLNMNR
jgi:type II secretory pathway pseudopilin PulG